MATLEKWPLCSLKESGCQPVTEAHWPQSCLKIMVSPVQIRVPPPKSPCYWALRNGRTPGAAPPSQHSANAKVVWRLFGGLFGR